MLIDRKRVDVIIPNYNETVLLSRAVNSVIHQGEVVNQIIIVDDGSDEEVIRYINSSFAGNDKIQILISARKNHPGVMREIGIKHSQAEWIAFLDADDFWEVDKLQKQIKFARENNFQIVCSDANLYRNFERVKQIYQFNVAPKISTFSLLRENIIINSSSLVQRECINSIGGYPQDYHLRGVEDYSVWLRLSIDFRIGFLNEALVNYEDLEKSFGKQQSVHLRIFAILDFLFWSKNKTSLFVRLYSKFYLFRILKRQ